MSSDGSSSVIVECLSSIKNGVSERIDNPILFPFIFSWLAWNYKFVIVVFSGASVEKKLVLIDAAYAFEGVHIALCKAGFWVVFPLLSTALFIYLFPKVSRWALGQWLKWLTIRNNSILKSRSERAMSPEEAEKLHQSNADLRSQLGEARREIVEQKGSIAELDEEVKSMRSKSSSGEGGTQLKIYQAVNLVLAENQQPMALDEIMDAIIVDDLFHFGANDPRGVLRNTIRKRCLNSKVKGATSKKYYRELPDGRYQLLSQSESVDELEREAG